VLFLFYTAIGIMVFRSKREIFLSSWRLQCLSVSTI